MTFLLGTGTLQLRSPAQAAPQLSYAGSSKTEPSDLDAIWRYAGSWRMETETLDSPYGKAGKRTANLRNDCWRSGEYIACRQIVDGESKVLLVFTCRRTGHTCTTYPVPSDGSPASSGTVQIEGDTWIFPWQTTDKDGKTTWFRVVNVWTDSTSIDYRQEYSTDQVHWTRTATGHEVKTSTN